MSPVSRRNQRAIAATTYLSPASGTPLPAAEPCHVQDPIRDTTCPDAGHVPHGHVAGGITRCGRTPCGTPGRRAVPGRCTARPGCDGRTGTNGSPSGPAAPGTWTRRPGCRRDACRLDSRKKQSWPIFIPGHNAIGRVATLDSSRVTCPENPGSMNPAVEWVSRPNRPRLDLPSSRAATSSARVRISKVEASTNCPGCNTNASEGSTSTNRVSSAAPVRVDDRVLVVVEQPEVPVDTHVDAGRLDHRGVVRIDPDPAGVDLSPNVPVGEQHQQTESPEVLSPTPACRSEWCRTHVVLCRPRCPTHVVLCRPRCRTPPPPPVIGRSRAPSIRRPGPRLSEIAWGN